MLFSVLLSQASRDGKASLGIRRFARKRRRLDEYDMLDAPLRMRYWRQMKEQGGFFTQKFEEMTPIEISQTVHLGAKMSVKNQDFWERAALSVGDVASSMTHGQLATACHAFGAHKWSDPRLVHAVAPALIKCCSELRPGDLAVVVQSFSRMRASHPAALAALAKAIEANVRLAGKGLVMIAESFADMQYRSSVFQRKLDAWCAADGLSTCSQDQIVALAHCTSLVAPENVGESTLVASLSEKLRGMAETLEAPALVLVVVAMARLRASDPNLVGSLQRAVRSDIHDLHLGSLPALLDSFAHLYSVCDAQGGSSSPSKERRAFLGQLSGRLTRRLRQLRPQDACRALQALDRIGLTDPYLLSEAKMLVPDRLSAWPAADLLRLLENYAFNGNVDGFMIPCLRRALLPVASVTMREEGQEGPQVAVDSASLAQLDDSELVRVAQAFTSLQHSEGLLAMFAALPLGGRTLVPSCELALAAFAPSEEEWPVVVSSLVAAEGNTDCLAEVLGQEVCSGWHARSQPENVTADTLLMAVCAFPGHPRRGDWAAALPPRASECSTALLPGLLFEAAREGEADGLCESWAEKELLRRVLGGERLHESIAVAAVRALAQRVRYLAPSELGPHREAVKGLAYVVSGFAQDGRVNAKSLVRVLQSLQALQVAAPVPIVQSLVAVADTLTPVEFISALRTLSADSVRHAQCGDSLSALATRNLALLRSSRQAWEMEALCKSLAIELGEIDREVEAEEGEEVVPPSQKWER